MSNSDGCLFYTKKKKKPVKDIIFLNSYKYTEIHYLQSKFPSVTVTVSLIYTLYFISFDFCCYSLVVRN